MTASTMMMIAMNSHGICDSLGFTIGSLTAIANVDIPVVVAW